MKVREQQDGVKGECPIGYQGAEGYGWVNLNDQINDGYTYWASWDTSIYNGWQS